MTDRFLFGLIIGSLSVPFCYEYNTGEHLESAIKTMQIKVVGSTRGAAVGLEQPPGWAPGDMPGLGQRGPAALASHTSPLIFTGTLQGRSYLHVTEEKTGAERIHATCPRTTAGSCEASRVVC